MADTSAALSEVRVVSMALNVPGPAAVARLVAGGARAVKVEPPAGDPLATLCRSWYDELHAGVEVRRIDLKRPAGMDALHTLLGAADVFISSQRPSALARLGADAPSLVRAHPTLRVLNIVGDSAQPEEAGHDLTYLARAGLLGPALPNTLLADLFGAERTCAAVLSLLRQAPGSRTQVALFEALDVIAAPLRHGLTAPGGPLGGANPGYAVYAALEGHVAVAALEPHFRARLYAALDLPDGSDLTAVMRQRTADEWEQWGQERDIPVAALRTGHRDTETQR